MEENNTKVMRDAYQKYLSSRCDGLYAAYKNPSNAKRRAWKYVQDLCYDYNGYGLRVVGHNSMVFSGGFIGYINDKKAFFYITPGYNRYMYIDD